MSVSHFIKDAKSWNRELLLQFFDEEYVDRILQTPIRGPAYKDQLLWKGQPLSDVSTKKLFAAVQEMATGE